MRVLLTGASGMVGRNFLEHPGADNFELLTPSRSQLNLLSYSDVEHYLRLNKPHMVIHAAGFVGGILSNMQHPVEHFLSNLDMGRNIVWAAFQAGIKQMINLGSSCMYPHNAENPLKEEMVLTEALEPTNEGYALAKIAISRLCQYIMSVNPEYEYKTIIPCNLYGRWDKFDLTVAHLLPAAIHKIHMAKEHGHKEVVIWGDGSCRREFMYTADLADALIYGLQHFAKMPSVINIGIGFDYTVDEYYQAAAEVLNYGGVFTHDVLKPSGMKRKVLNIAKQQQWGWSPKTNLHDGISRTYKFFLEQVNAHCGEEYPR